jgi:hypothetical protein
MERDPLNPANRSGVRRLSESTPELSGVSRAWL